MTKEDTKRVYGFLTLSAVEEALNYYKLDLTSPITRKRLKILGYSDSDREEIWHLEKARQLLLK